MYYGQTLHEYDNTAVYHLGFITRDPTTLDRSPKSKTGLCWTMLVSS